MRNFYIIFCIFFIATISSFGQTNLIEKLLNENNDSFGEVLSNVDSLEVQIIYTQINRDKNNFPSFKTYKYRVDPTFFFYPASTVKLPLAVLSLEKLNNLKINGLDKFTPLRIDSVREKQSKVIKDTSSANGLPCIAQYIKKIFLVSDNDSYNRLYEFLGTKEINERLRSKGFKDEKIVHRFIGGLTKEDNNYTNPFTFYNSNKVVYQQPEKFNKQDFSLPLKNTIKGIGYWDSKDSLINEPFDFSGKNFISLENLTSILRAIIFPEATPKKQKFNLTNNDYQFLYKYMSMFPRESKKPTYDSSYYDSYVKYFLFGDSHKPIPTNFRIFNKVGLAYGYLTDVAYIVDFENKVEFMLSALIHVNKDGVYNDGKYEYAQIGLPFLSKLGKVFYEYEKNRAKKYLPDLTKFKIDY